jgi:hypothetical protein
MKMRAIFVNCSVLLVTAAIGLLLCELGARLIFNPADVLSVEIIKDPILGGTPSPHAKSDFDAWGFRNREVPKTSDIVALGDSHTYGNTARMIESWPYVAANLTGRQVYNMGMGGYGPNQYFYLLQTKALSLKPRTIICGLYMGDDFENAFSITYGLDHWAYLRQLPPQNVDSYIWEIPTKDAWHKGIRLWLSRHSVVYQLVVHTSLGDRLKGGVQIRKAVQDYPGVATSLILPEKNILEAFRPQDVLNGLNQENPVIREGMRITFEMLKQMNDIAQQNNIQFVVVVIPTKPMVFSNYLEHNSQIPLDDVIDRLYVNERLARAQTFKFMTEANISYVDALPALQKSAGQGLYASSAADMHPNKNGYRVIGEAVAEALKQGAGKK